MTKKEYMMIAEILRDAPVGVKCKRDMIAAFMVGLGADNPRFDRVSFTFAASQRSVMTTGGPRRK